MPVLFLSHPDRIFHRPTQSDQGLYLCGYDSEKQSLGYDDLWRLSENYIADEKNRKAVFEAGMKDIRNNVADYGLVEDEESQFRAITPHLPLLCLLKQSAVDVWDVHWEGVSMASAVLVVTLIISWRYKGDGSSLPSSLPLPHLNSSFVFFALFVSPFCEPKPCLLTGRRSRECRGQ